MVKVCHAYLCSAGKLAVAYPLQPVGELGRLTCAFCKLHAAHAPSQIYNRLCLLHTSAEWWVCMPRMCQRIVFVHFAEWWAHSTHTALEAAHVPALFSRLHCRRCFHSVAPSLRFSNNKPARTTAFCRYYYSAQTKFSRKNNTIQNKLIEYDIDVRVKNVLACGQKWQ